MNKSIYRILLAGVVLVLIFAFPFNVFTEGKQEKKPEGKAAITGFDWRRFEGETIAVLYGRDPGVEYVGSRVSEFEALTGIRVIVDDMPWYEATTKKILECRTKSDTYDVYLSLPYQERMLFINNGWYVPLNDYINNPTLTNPDYDWSDFGRAGLDWVTTDDGKIYTIPTKFDLWGLFARKGILRKYGLEFPQTMEGLFAAAQKVHDPPNIYGCSFRGKKPENSGFFSWLLYAYGGSWFDKEGKLATASPAAVDAVLAYAELMRYNPPGGLGFSWLEARDSFSRGEGVFFVDGYGGSTSYMEMPEKSKIAGDVEYGFLPGAKGNPKVYMSTQLGWLLNPYSNKKGPGWYFIQWATSKKMALDVLMDVGDTWARMSPYKDPRYTSSKGFIPAWNEAVKIGLSQPTFWFLPFIDALGEFRDDFGLILLNAVKNPDRERIAKELQEVTKKHQEMEDAKK